MAPIALSISYLVLVLRISKQINIIPDVNYYDIHVYTSTYRNTLISCGCESCYTFNITDPLHSRQLITSDCHHNLKPIQQTQ